MTGDSIRKSPGFRVLITLGVFLTFMFVAGQTLSLIDHDLTVSLGLQESEAEISDVGVAFARGFAFGDTIFYIPLFVIGVIGLLRNTPWGVFSMVGAMAITVYWPVVHLFAIFDGKDVMRLSFEKYVAYSIVLPLIAAYGLWGMWFLYANRKKLAS